MINKTFKLISSFSKTEFNLIGCRAEESNRRRPKHSIFEHLRRRLRPDNHAADDGPDDVQELHLVLHRRAVQGEGHGTQAKKLAAIES